MSMQPSEAIEVLRAQVQSHQRQYFHYAWVAILFLSMIALVGLKDGMPLWQAVLACSILALIALFCILRALGKLGRDLRVELERWLDEPGLIEGYDSKMVSDGHEDWGDGDYFVGGGAAGWRIRIYLSAGGKVSMGMGRKEKTQFIRALRATFPDIRSRRIRKK